MGKATQGRSCPGFVDLQVNGFLGVDFSGPELTAADFRMACREVLSRGTAAFLPTIVTSPVEVLCRNLELVAETAGEAEFQGRLLGIHLEGPFISREPGGVGAHNAEWVLEPSIETFDDLQAAARGQIRMLTIAADATGAEALARHAGGQGVCVSLGHHLATGADLQRLAGAGATALTHLGNGVPAMLPRHPNPIWAALANDDLTATIIADGQHLPASVIKSFLRAKGIERIVVISDGAAVAGLPAGTYENTALGKSIVLEESGKLHNPEKGCLAGSSATMLGCMNHLASLGLLGFEQLRTVGFANPLKLIGLSRGDIDTADILQFDALTCRFELIH